MVGGKEKYGDYGNTYGGKGGLCPSRTVLDEKSSEILILRRRRDEVARKSTLGVIFIRFYYFNAPIFVWFLHTFPAFQVPFRLFLKKCAVALESGLVHR
jgi:hypothetical protein